MKSWVKFAAAVSLAMALSSATALAANRLTWSTSTDLISMDPHAASVGINNTGLMQVYEGLVNRDQELKLVPGLATSWKAVGDNAWEFKLREGVKFHDGKAFTADDVAFSLMRAKEPTSDYRVAVSSIKEVQKVDNHTVRVITEKPDPILPEWLTTIFIMSKAWAEENKAVKPQDFKNNEETFSARNANGTGPFMLKERVPGVQTVMVANPNYWDRANFPIGYDELVHKPVRSAPTRIAGLIAGEVDLVMDPPLQDIARVEADPKLKVSSANEIRSIFLGFDVKSDTLRYGSGADKNPFADKRVRQAVYQAINADVLRRQIMRNNSVTAGSIFSTYLNGVDDRFNQRLPFDQAAAKKLMEDAGYGKGFKVRLDCTNDRYVNDEAICQALVPMLSRIGVEVELNLRPASQAFPAMLKRETSFFMLGFDSPTVDPEYIFRFVLHSPTGTLGTWNFGSYSNAEVDKLIADIGTTVDRDKRIEMMRRVIQISRDEIAYVPLHFQVLNWAMNKKVNLGVRSDNKPQFKYAKPAS